MQKDEDGGNDMETGYREGSGREELQEGGWMNRERWHTLETGRY
jgi:hypothetical protein